jgi:hypothetical protein
LDALEPVIFPVRRGVRAGRLAPMSLHDHAFLYVDCDVPAGVTLDSWRSAKAPPPRRRRLDVLMRRGRSHRTAAARSLGQLAHDSGLARE